MRYKFSITREKREQFVTKLLGNLLNSVANTIQELQKHIILH